MVSTLLSAPVAYLPKKAKAQKRMKNPKKVSYHAQNQQKSNPTCVGSVPCTETGQNEVSKQTTEEVQGANPGLLLFENQNNSLSTISWSAVHSHQSLCALFSPLFAINQ
jgi:hypothetical protein